MHVAPNLSMVGGSLGPHTTYYNILATAPTIPRKGGDATKAAFGICRFRKSAEHHPRKTWVLVTPPQQGSHNFLSGSCAQRTVAHQQGNNTPKRQGGARQAEPPMGRFVIPGQWGRRQMVAGSFPSNHIWREGNNPPKGARGVSVTDGGGGGSKRPRHSTGNDSKHGRVQPCSMQEESTPSQHGRSPKNGETRCRGGIDNQERRSKAGHVSSVVVAGRWLEAKAKPWTKITSPVESDADGHPQTTASAPASPTTTRKLLWSRWKTARSSEDANVGGTNRTIPTLQLRAPMSSSTTGGNGARNDVGKGDASQLPVAPVDATSTRLRAGAGDMHDDHCEGTNAGARGMVTSPPSANVTDGGVCVVKHGASPQNCGRAVRKGVTLGVPSVEEVPTRPPSFRMGNPITPSRCVT